MSEVAWDGAVAAVFILSCVVLAALVVGLLGAVARSWRRLL